MSAMPTPTPFRRQTARKVPHARAVLLALAVLGLLAGCSREADRSAGGGADAGPVGVPGGVVVPPRNDSERTWVGLLPCRDCQGVDTRLVLRTRGARRDYQMVETYLAEAGGARFERAGRWVETRVTVDGEEATVFVLDPGQQGQQYRLLADGALVLLEPGGLPPRDPLPYRLQRL
jgi:copper homeostasis protein (lipoprotein)